MAAHLFLQHGEIDGLKCPSLPLEADFEGETIASSSRLTVKPRNLESFKLLDAQ